MKKYRPSKTELSRALKPLLMYPNRFTETDHVCSLKEKIRKRKEQILRKDPVLKELNKELKAERRKRVSLFNRLARRLSTLKRALVEDGPSTELAKKIHKLVDDYNTERNR